jgi:hypothetical protein
MAGHRAGHLRTDRGPPARKHTRRRRLFPARTAPTLIRTSYDPEADALFVWFAPEGTKSAETEEVAPGILLDFDASG